MAGLPYSRGVNTHSFQRTISHPRDGLTTELGLELKVNSSFSMSISLSLTKKIKQCKIDSHLTNALMGCYVSFYLVFTLLF